MWRMEDVPGTSNNEELGYPAWHELETEDVSVHIRQVR